eukprot:jgi/Hompol1/5029/HPOL_000564-RA
MATKQTRDLLEAKTPGKYVQVLHQQLSEMTASLYECVDALAEEHKHARRWRSQCEIMAERLENIRALFDEERRQRVKFYNKRQLQVNALLPVARPSASQWAWMHEEDLRKMRLLQGNASALINSELLARIAAAATAATTTAAARFGAHDAAGGEEATRMVDNPSVWQTPEVGVAHDIKVQPTNSFTQEGHIGQAADSAAAAQVDVLAGSIDERSLPPLPRKVPILLPFREKAAHHQPTPEKVEIFIPSLQGASSFGRHSVGSMQTPTKLPFHQVRKHLERMQ